MKVLMALFGLLVIGAMIAGALGCVNNLIDLIALATNHAAIDGMFLLRIVGLFVPPLGAVLGYV